MQHTKLRSQLTSEKVDQLVYIHMNRQVFRDSESLSEVPQPNDAELEAELLRMEDEEMNELIRKMRLLDIEF